MKIKYVKILCVQMTLVPGALGILLTVLISVPVLSQTPDIIWLETEKFDDPGGWTNDWQFIDQMGSPYLLAVGLGTPVKDAAATIKVDKPGRYRMWVRSLAWSPEEHPGKFELYVNHKKAGKTLGESGKESWIWEEGGVVSLKNTNEIRLKDLTGYYSRCDVIAFSSDLNGTPHTEVDAIARLREKQGAISQEIKRI